MYLKIVYFNNNKNVFNISLYKYKLNANKNTKLTIIKLNDLNIIRNFYLYKINNIFLLLYE